MADEIKSIMIPIDLDAFSPCPLPCPLLDAWEKSIILSMGGNLKEEGYEGDRIHGPEGAAKRAEYMAKNSRLYTPPPAEDKPYEYDGDFD